jgi:hypothetical protein
MSPEVPIIVLILAISIYFFCKRILRKYNIGTKSNRKFLALIPSLILSPILYFGLIIIWIFSMSYYPTNDFNKNEWNSNIEERYKMSEDIIESEILIGKTRDEVIELLGNNFSTNNKSRLSYKLEFIPGLFNIDPDYLDIRFENGVVINVIQYKG